MWLAATVGLSAVFGRLAVYNLANFRPVSNDEVELIAVGYKLATRGVLGSDMYVGFFGADQHYLWTPPLQHLLDAAAFLSFGAGVAQARWVSVLAAVATVWVVGRLAFRWFGPGAALICELLLIFWRSDLIDAPAGLPLASVARAARYDVLAVAFAWLTIWAMDTTLRCPRPGRAFLVGLCGGLAALSQFFGVFVLPVVVMSWMWIHHGPRRMSALLWIAAGAALVVIPWLAYLAAHAADFAGQLLVYGGRGDFSRPSFYLANVIAEPARYAHLLQPATDPASQLSVGLVVLAVPPAALVIGGRALRRGSTGDRLLSCSLLTFGVLLALLDQTKTALYAILLVPSICLVLAAAWAGALEWVFSHSSGASRARPPWRRLTIAAASVAVLAAIVFDGVRAYQLDLFQASSTSPYLAVGQQVEAATAPGGVVLGPERWWWALQHDHPYLSLRSLWFQWVADAGAGSDSPHFVDWVTRARPANIIVNNNIRDDVRDFPQTLQAQFWTFLDVCAQPVATIDDATYLDTVVYRVLAPPPAGCG